MDYTQLSRPIRRLADKNRKQFNKKMGYEKNHAKFNDNLTAKFIFSDYPKEEHFWWVVSYCKDMPHLEIMPEYKEWQEKRRKKLFYSITFVLSLLLYGWLLYKLYLYLDSTKEIINILFK